jgi:hypothetical protein
MSDRKLLPIVANPIVTGRMQGGGNVSVRLLHVSQVLT